MLKAKKRKNLILIFYAIFSFKMEIALEMLSSEWSL